MLGAIDPRQREVTIVGAGFAGLVLAHRLLELGFEVTLYEREKRVGGLIETKQTPHGIVESAAHSMLATPAVRELCCKLGVELLAPRERARFVLREGKLRKFPFTFSEALGTLSRAAFVRGRESGTMEEFGLRHFGQAALDYGIAPMITGIYAAEPREISLEAAFPSLKVGERQSFLTSRLGREKADRAMVAPRGGMGALVAALEKELGSRIKISQPLDRLPDVPNLVLAVPAQEAARLLDPHELARSLAELRYSALTSVTVFADAADFRELPRGVGVLMPWVEKRKILGILFNSSAFAERSASESEISLTVMLQGQAVESAIREELEALFGFKKGAGLDLFPHVWKRAIPLYDEQLIRTWKLARETWCARPGRMLFGNYTGQVSLRGMVDLAAGLHVS
jgi:oxygen-dependent protoporphyrinogen oxidase